METSTDYIGVCTEIGKCLDACVGGNGIDYHKNSGSQRRGRDLQRYTESRERLIAGCIPFRCPEGESMQSAQVLMITSSSGENSYVFPKGGWEIDETVEAAAARETIEEAGVHGVIEGPVLGTFHFQSKKVANFNEGKCVAHMFSMRVLTELQKWPEQFQRTRFWVSIEEASEKCRHDWMKEALKVWMARVGYK